MKTTPQKKTRKPEAQAPLKVKDKVKEDSATAEFPVVGIGASAGGLEALELFFTHAPVNTGVAFVVIQHLDPAHKGALPELLQRVTKLPVQEITDNLQILPDHVYVIPSNADLGLFRGVFRLTPPSEPRGLRLPIDIFFQALADDRGKQAVGVILSGMGSDGTKGIQAIKGRRGLVFVQTPESAKYDGMPSSAIKTGIVDLVAQPEKMAGQILTFLGKKVSSGKQALADSQSQSFTPIEKILAILRLKTSHDFSQYKKSTIDRRVERRMSLHQLTDLDAYADFLRRNPEEVQLLFKELLIGVTSFFRDPEVWEQLKTDVLPLLVAEYPEGTTFRAWVAGCSTGEEAYTLAILFKEFIQSLLPRAHYSLQIFATDLDKDAIDKARSGVFSKEIVKDLTKERLNRFFTPDPGGYRAAPEIREMIIFAPQNVIMDPPFTRMDILTCRNLLIYFDASLQKRLLPLFSYSLKPTGFLVLGNSETTSNAPELFEAMPGKAHIYKNIVSFAQKDLLKFPNRSVKKPEQALLLETAVKGQSLQSLVESILVKQFAPPTTLCTDKGDILYFSGKTGGFLEPAVGKANFNIFAMARDGLSLPLAKAFSKSMRSKSAVSVDDIKISVDGRSKSVNLSVQYLLIPKALKGSMLVTFDEKNQESAESNKGGPSRLRETPEASSEISLKLRAAQEELQLNKEEMQASQEELKSTNEELQSTNEELQSTNEELTTSKEEMQSMNEELQTINQELQAKVDELSQASDDMNNLLNSTDIATLFLDKALKVRRYTTKMSNIMSLIPGDAGRPITDLVSELNYSAFEKDARTVLDRLETIERDVLSHSGRKFRVRTMPYRTKDDRIDGLVITFSELR